LDRHLPSFLRLAFSFSSSSLCGRRECIRYGAVPGMHFHLAMCDARSSVMTMAMAMAGGGREGGGYDHPSARGLPIMRAAPLSVHPRPLVSSHYPRVILAILAGHDAPGSSLHPLYPQWSFGEGMLAFLFSAMGPDPYFVYPCFSYIT
jgi:hypothetical protein